MLNCLYIRYSPTRDTLIMRFHAIHIKKFCMPSLMHHFYITCEQGVTRQLHFAI